MNHADAEKQLMMPSNVYGSYLVRGSKNRPGTYSLSVRDTEQVKHYRIMQLDNGEFYVARHTTFQTIAALVAYYQKQAGGLCTNLTKPCAVVYGLWEIDRREIKLGRKLTSNEFVEVWKGLWNGVVGITPVFVKRPRPGKIAINDFLLTANLMKIIQHKNIIKFYGVCTKEEPVYIITEFMKHNSLLEYLHGEGGSTEVPQLIDMASQVAAGMAYLEKLNIMIHRDLGARNILVGEHQICKVANFESSTVLFKAPSAAIVAIRWTAPEAAMYNRWSTKSDVWSFGVLLYEVITYGCPPYPGMLDSRVLEQLEQGYRMPQPTECPDKLYNIMLTCWRREPENRPTFETLQWQLEDFPYL